MKNFIRIGGYKDIRGNTYEILVEAEYARTYREKLFSEIEKYLLLALPQINAKQFLAGCRAMSADDLQTLCKSLQTQAADTLPPALQLKHNEPKTDRQNNRAFCI